MERQLKFVLSGEDRSAGSVIGKTADTAESASSKIGGAFQKLGSKIGGEFGEVLSRVGEGLEQTGEKGMSLGKKMAITGGAIAGVGVLLQAAGSKEKQATDQLKAAIDATGSSYSDYSDKIEKTVKHEENYAHSAVDTKTALQTLTMATGDTQKALDAMGVVTDLAAARHISLAEAAGLVSKILGGGGAKTLAAYGIQMRTNADGTKDVAGAIADLSAKLNGQAAASMNNFGAKVDAVKVKVGDFVAEWGQKLGTTLTVTGTVLGVVSSGLDILAARAERAAAKELELAAAEERAAAAAGTAAAGSLEAAAANEALAASSSGASASIGRAVVGVGALAAAAYGIGTLLKGPIQQLTGQTDGFGYAMQNSTRITETFKQALTDSGGEVTKNVTSVAALQLQQSGLADKAAKAGISLADMTKGITGSDDQFKALVDTWRKSGDPSGKTIVNLAAMRNEFVNGKSTATDYDSAVRSLGSSSDATAAAQARMKVQTAAVAKEQLGLRVQLADVTNKAFGEAARLGDLNNALDRLSNNSIDATQQELHLRDALASASQTLKGNGSAINDNTVKGRANKEWLLEQVSAINSHVSSVGKQTGSVQKATVALSSDTAQLRAAASAAGLNKAQVDALIRSYAATPRKIQTEIAADTAAAKKKIKDLQAQINALQGKALQIQINENISVNRAENAAGQIGIKHAGGGYLSEGWNTAGEGTATELMYKQGSQVRVLTNQQSAPMLAGGGPTNIHINLPGLYGGAEAGRVVAGILEKYVGAGGQINIVRGIR